MLELRTLGTAGIHDENGELLSASPKPLALLTYLSVARPCGPHQRETLLALFYPELDHDHARNSLRQLVHALREVVGDAVESGRQTVGVEAARLRSDVRDFEAALAAKDPAKAVATYAGPFLQGFFLTGCPEFEEWVESERNRLRRAYEGALERLALESDAAGEASEAAGWWRQLAEADPFATRVTVRLMAALEVAGDRAAALDVAERHAERLREEFDAEPSPEVEALARRLRAQPAPGVPEPRASTRERLASAVAGRYRVTGVAGAGGMALVYRADDLKLGRPVALKVLRPELAAAIGHERFLNEVDIAAGLSHPNILPLHDAGAANGLLYYVMPYVEGESLRARLAREGPLEPVEAVRIAREVAGALAYAHGRGIIHRDVKPANILLLENHAVVSDFGVAHAVGETLDDPPLAAATGTPAYMSPEQLAGSPDIDARTDLYSLGCVLHEMLTGAPPDLDTDPQAVFSARPGVAVPARSRVRGTVPAAVVATLSRALAEDPVERFRTAEELVAALDAKDASIPASSGKWGRPAFAGVATVLLATAALVIRESTRPFTIAAGIPQQVTFDAGIESVPAISPDGSEVAYIAGDRQLFVKSISGGTAVHVAGDAVAGQWSPDGNRIFFGGWTGIGSTFAFKEVDRTGGPIRILERPVCYNPALSPDGTRVACWKNLEGDGYGIYFHDVGAGTELGGPVAIIPESGEIHSLRWSPDGRNLAWVRSPNRGDPQSTRALIANELVTSAILVLREGGEPVQITDGKHRDMIPAWLPDSRHLLFVSDRDGPRDIYVLDAEAPGEPQRVTFGGENPGHLSLSADGRHLAYSKLRFRRNIWSLPIPERDAVSVARGRPVTAARWNERVLWHDLSPDGDSIAFDFRANPGDKPHVYKMALEGGDPVQLTADAYGGYRPVWSPDGREIAFARDAENRVELWVMDADGGNQRREVEALGGRDYFDWSGDGLQLIYEQGSELWAISRDSLRQGWDTPVEFGEPGRWYGGECQLPQRVRGGSGIVCNAFHERSPIEPFSSLLWLSPDGQVERRYDPTPFDEAEPRFSAAVLRRDTTDLGILWWTRYPRFSPDGSTLYFFGNPGGRVFVMSMPAEGGEPERIVAVDDPSIFPWSPKNDGRGLGALTIGKDAIYLSVGDWDSDIWVIDLEW